MADQALKILREVKMSGLLDDYFVGSDSVVFHSGYKRRRRTDNFLPVS